MKHRIVWMTILLLSAVCAFSQEDEQTPRMPQQAQRPAPPNPAPAPRIVVEKPRDPSAGHKALEPFVGAWKTEVRLWTDAASSTPTVTKGTAVFKMALGGRYLQGDFKGEDQGHAFNALEIMGFDNVHLKYTGYWIDNTSTWALTSLGTASADSKVFRLNGRQSDPETRRQSEVHQVISFETPDKIILQFFEGSLNGMSMTSNRPGAAPGSRDGTYHLADEFKKMEIVCTRVKE